MENLDGHDLRFGALIVHSRSRDAEGCSVSLTSRLRCRPYLSVLCLSGRSPPGHRADPGSCQPKVDAVFLTKLQGDCYREVDCRGACYPYKHRQAIFESVADAGVWLDQGTLCLESAPAGC